MGLIDSLKEGFLGLFFPGPGHCPICGKALPPAEDIPCPSCRRQVQRVTAPFCLRCGKPLLAQAGYCSHCSGRRPSFLQARAAGVYAGVLRRAIHSFKYRGDMSILPYLQYLLQDCLAQNSFPEGVDIIIPVPLHPLRERERGFNQAALLAAGVGRCLARPVDYRSLSRRLNTPPTSGLTRWERIETLGDAFTSRGGRLKGKVVLLVDDILTTGSTATGCTSALLQGGAAGVYVLTVATVPRYK